MSYSFYYGCVFPVAFVAKSMPADNPITNGIVDGTRRVSDWVDDLKHKKTGPAVAVKAWPAANRHDGEGQAESEEEVIRADD